jgi:hypothetical protein
MTTSNLTPDHKEKLREAKRELEYVRAKLPAKEAQDLSQRIERISSLIAAVQL